MNFILRIYFLSTLRVVAQHTEVLTVKLDLTPDISKNLHFMIEFIILLGLRVYVSKSRDIYYSFGSF